MKATGPHDSSLKAAAVGLDRRGQVLDCRLHLVEERVESHEKHLAGGQRLSILAAGRRGHLAKSLDQGGGGGHLLPCGREAAGLSGIDFRNKVLQRIPAAFDQLVDFDRQRNGCKTRDEIIFSAGFFQPSAKKLQGSKTQTQAFFFSKKLKSGNRKMFRAFLRVSQIYLVYVSDSTQNPRIIWILQSKLNEFPKT